MDIATSSRPTAFVGPVAMRSFRPGCSRACVVRQRCWLNWAEPPGTSTMAVPARQREPLAYVDVARRECPPWVLFAEAGRAAGGRAGAQLLRDERDQDRGLAAGLIVSWAAGRSGP